MRTFTLTSLRRATLAVALLAATTAIALPGVGAAATTKPTVIENSKLNLHSLVTCKKTGISGPTGSVTVLVYALKGHKPAKAALGCKRADAVVKAGKRDIFAKLTQSWGKKVEAEGVSYALDDYFGPGASGPIPGFVGGGTIVIASYASGR